MHEDIQTVWVLTPKPACPLGYTDLLVYSYLAKRARYGGKLPTKVAISQATCLTEKTVADAISRLQDIGFATENGSPVHQPDHFFGRGGSRRGCHWYETVQFYPCYIRAEGSKLSTSDTMVYSYLLHLSQMDSKPTRLTNAYVANGVCMKEGTIPGIFARLKEYQLLNITPTAWQVTKRLHEVQKAWFMPKRSAPTEAVTIEEYIPDLAALEALKPAAVVSDTQIAPELHSDIMTTGTQADDALLAFLVEQFEFHDYKEVEYERFIKGTAKLQNESQAPIPKKKWNTLFANYCKILNDERSKRDSQRSLPDDEDRKDLLGSSEVLGTAYKPRTEK